MYAHVFDNPIIVEAPKANVKKAKEEKDTDKKPTKEVDDSKRFGKELAALNFGLKQREKVLADRAEVSQRPIPASKRGNTTTFSSLSSIFGDIDSEIERELKKTKWPRLVDSYKLKFIKAYLDDLTSIGKSEKLSIAKELKVNNKYRALSNVSYDMDVMKVLCLGETFMLANGKSIEL